MDDIYSLRISQAVEELEDGKTIEEIVEGDICVLHGKPNDFLRRIVFHRLVLIELFVAREVGQECDQDEYLKRFPGFDGIVQATFLHFNHCKKELFPEIHEFIVTDTLGEGGQGSAFKAYSIKFQNFVAVKVLRSGDSERFEQEARIQANLKHPNIVGVYDLGTFREKYQQEQKHFISMGFVDGSSLESFVQMQGPRLNARQAAAATRTVANALDFAHQRGVIHRDIKPANVLMPKAEETNLDEFDRNLFLTDFGLAKLIETDGPTVDGGILGTPAYLSPEQARGELATTRSDVHGLGTLLYALLQGIAPFKRRTHVESILAAADELPAALHKGVPRDLATICGKCLNKHPDDRYGSAKRSLMTLIAFLTGNRSRPAPSPCPKNLSCGAVASQSLR